jgi:SAM-dependent methyltransferase
MSGPTFGDYARLVRHSGLYRAWSYFWQAHVFDLIRRTDTAHWRPKAGFSSALPNIGHGYRYDASYTSEVRRCLAIAAMQMAPDRCDFVDLGCGKGKVLLMAARMGYRSLTGVEYDPDLARIARANLEIARVAAGVIEDDASAFAAFAPRCVVYMFCPFDEHLLEKVASTLRRVTQECVVIYNNPRHAAVFADWRLLASTSGRHVHLESQIYHHHREGPSGS